MSKPNLIILEGFIPSSEKSHQLSLLTSEMTTEKVYAKHNINDNNIYGVLDEKNNKQINPYSIYLNELAKREKIWHTQVEPNLSNHSTILLDQYTSTSLLYQTPLFNSHHDQANFIKYVMDLEYTKLHFIEPSQVIFLTTSLASLERPIHNEYQDGLISTSEYQNKLNAIKDLYTNINCLLSYLHWPIVNCEENNQIRSEEAISNDVYKLVRK